MISIAIKEGKYNSYEIYNDGRAKRHYECDSIYLENYVIEDSTKCITSYRTIESLLDTLKIPLDSNTKISYNEKKGVLVIINPFCDYDGELVEKNNSAYTSWLLGNSRVYQYEYELSVEFFYKISAHIDQVLENFKIISV